MRMSENTCTLAPSTSAGLSPWWLTVSSLHKRHLIDLPLAGNPYISALSQVGKGFHARKDGQGRWRFEVLEKAEWEIPEAKAEQKRVGVDVGLNVIAATSQGHTLGATFKPAFDAMYQKVKTVRANRQRQGLKENSPRLDRLESKLSGMCKTVTGQVANQLIQMYPDTVFVLEDLDLSGAKGSKRFCYRGLSSALERKTAIEKVNPAYSSQLCSSCGHVSRRNRSGINFCCEQCGKKSHADVHAAQNLLGRSKTKQVVCAEVALEAEIWQVKEVLVKLYWRRRNPHQDCPPDFLRKYAPEPSGQGRTVGGGETSPTRIALNQVSTADVLICGGS
jgi:putative transposase